MAIKYCLGNDPGEITGIYGPEEKWQVAVGIHVDKIDAYVEDGNTVWFAIFKNGKIVQRINSNFVETVSYR